jgi:hypothetical protein
MNVVLSPEPDISNLHLIFRSLLFFLEVFPYLPQNNIKISFEPNKLSKENNH